MTVMTTVDAAGAIDQRFLAILPALQSQLRNAFRRFRPEQQNEALQEATANAFAAFVRLWQRSRLHVAGPTSLARYAVWQWFAGRQVGSQLNAHDVSSRYAQRQHAIRLERLDRYDHHRKAWSVVMVEDRRTPVPDQAAFRVDFPAWLRQLSHRNRRIALHLASGASTSDVAERFGVSWGRISQLRRELHRSWLQFHGELPTANLVAA